MKTRRSDSRLHRGRRFDVSLRADPRNADYPLTIGVDIPPVTRVWDCPVALDQGSEGKCVGYAGAHFYGSEDRIQPINKRLANRFYREAQKVDEWPGENYEGTSVNGLMAYLRAEGLVGKYRWVFDLETLKRTLSYAGPVIVGSEWREECSYPDQWGFIDFDGPARGGHATCWRGINVEEGYFLIQQSWGPKHGLEGVVKMRFEDAAELLRTGPQIVFPEKRALTKLSKPRRWWQFW